VNHEGSTASLKDWIRILKSVPLPPSLLSNRDILTLDPLHHLHNPLFSHVSAPMASRDFIIVRLGDVTDPAAPLEFFPPKGSDELHDALRRAYPHLPNLQSRMREAVIEFYLEERSAEESFPSQVTPDMMELSFIPSPDSSFGASAAPTIYTPPSTEDVLSSSAQTPTSATPSQQDLMTVWTLPTSAQAKIHRRRNMTADEKLKYKAKRLTGACEDCRRRRRKVSEDRISTIYLSCLSFLSSSPSRVVIPLAISR